MQIPDLNNSILPIIASQAASSASPANAGEAAGQAPGNEARLKKACQEFEGQFFDLMLQEMRKTIPKDQLLGDDGHTEEIFTGMMDDQISQDMAKHGGANDLSAQLYRQLTGANSTQPTPANPSSQISPLLGAGGVLGAGGAMAAGVPSGTGSKPGRKLDKAPSTQDGSETNR